MGFLVKSQFSLLLYLYQMLVQNKIKKCLAPPRKDARHLNLQLKKKSPRVEPPTVLQKSNNTNPPNSSQIIQKHTAQTFQQKYRNKSISSLPAPLLIAFSALKTLDISRNQLNDEQLELVMNSCTKLTSLCIQQNLNILIPSSLYKLKQLVNFRHDWCILFKGKEQVYEQNLSLLKITLQKPDNITKIKKTSGIDFQIYCLKVCSFAIDSNLQKKVQLSNVISNYTKQIILKCIKQYQVKNKAKITKPIIQKEQLFDFNALCGFSNKNLERPPNFSLLKQKQKQKKPQSVIVVHPKNNISLAAFNQEQSDAYAKKIKIQDIRDISDIQTTQTNSFYYNADMPLHELLGNFDSNHYSASNIDGLLLKGYNPNQYDKYGLSPYHICVIKNQRKGFDYLLNICANNNGFFDLQMPSHKQLRNILHYSVFLKNYQFTKKLIQFGFPTNLRDSYGSRIVHLVDSNVQFLLLLRKLLRKRQANARSQTEINTQHQRNRKRYIKHPLRYKISYSNNQHLLQMFQSAQSTVGKRFTH